MKRTELQRKAPLRRKAQLERSARLKTYRGLRTRTKPVAVKLRSLVRQIVLLRDQGCLMGKSGRTGCSTILQAAHIMPTGTYPAMQYELTNVICLCHIHHIFGRYSWHKDPIGAVAWFKATFGEARMEQLIQLARMRTSKPDPTAVKLYLTQELKRLA